MAWVFYWSMNLALQQEHVWYPLINKRLIQIFLMLYQGVLF